MAATLAQMTMCQQGDRGDGGDGIKGGQNGDITVQNGMAGQEQQQAV